MAKMDPVDLELWVSQFLPNKTHYFRVPSTNGEKNKTSFENVSGQVGPMGGQWAGMGSGNGSGNGNGSSNGNGSGNGNGGNYTYETLTNKSNDSNARIKDSEIENDQKSSSKKKDEDSLDEKVNEDHQSLGIARIDTCIIEGTPQYHGSSPGITGVFDSKRNDAFSPYPGYIGNGEPSQSAVDPRYGFAPQGCLSADEGDLDNDGSKGNDANGSDKAKDKEQEEAFLFDPSEELEDDDDGDDGDIDDDYFRMTMATERSQSNGKKNRSDDDDFEDDDDVSMD